MDINTSFNVYGENFRPIIDEEFDYNSKYRSIIPSTENPNVDPYETEIFNNKILNAMYFFAALLAFFFMYACCTCYCLRIKRRVDEHRETRRQRLEIRRRWSTPRYRRRQPLGEESASFPGSYSGFLNFNPVQRQLEEKTRQDPNRLSEFVFGRDIPEEEGVKKVDRSPSYIILDDELFGEGLVGATGFSNSLNQNHEHFEESLEQVNIQEYPDEERRFHELAPSERPKKWRLREVFPSYFEKDDRERKNFPEDFQDILNPNIIPEPTNQYVDEFKQQQKKVKKRGAIPRTLTIQENMGKGHFGEDPEENTSLYETSNRTSTRKTSYVRQKSIKSEAAQGSYISQTKERKFFPEDLLCSRKSPEQSNSNIDAANESSPNDSMHPNKTPQETCEKRKPDKSPLRDMNMNSLSLENIEIKSQSSPNRLVRSSPPPNILRRQCSIKRKCPRRSSS